MTPCNIFGCVIDDESASSMTKTVTGGGKNKSGTFVELRMYVSCIVYGTFGDHFLSAHT